MLSLAQSKRGHFVTLIEVSMHLISLILDILFPRHRFPAHRLLSLSKNVSFVFNNVDLIRIKAKLTNFSLKNGFSMLYCGDVSIV